MTRTTIDAELLQHVVQRSTDLLLAGSRMLESIERAMDDVAWPESDEETALDDIVIHVEAALKKRNKAARSTSHRPRGEKKAYTAEEREHRTLKKAQRELDRKAAEMKTPMGTSDDLEDQLLDLDNSSSSLDSAEWSRVLNVIDTLHQRFDRQDAS